MPAFAAVYVCCRAEISKCGQARKRLLKFGALPSSAPASNASHPAAGRGDSYDDENPAVVKSRARLAFLDKAARTNREINAAAGLALRSLLKAADEARVPTFDIDRAMHESNPKVELMRLVCGEDWIDQPLDKAKPLCGLRIIVRPDAGSDCGSDASGSQSIAGGASCHFDSDISDDEVGDDILSYAPAAPASTSNGHGLRSSSRAAALNSITFSVETPDAVLSTVQQVLRDNH
eukprot:SAG31_NODE_20_length_34168_cov_33.651296_42_plen_234_part_00